MALSVQDLTHGVDATGVNPITGADLNSLVDLSAPVLDGVNEGKGIVLWTIDSAADTPRVPDATVVTKWKRYIWMRVPFAGAADKAPSFYAWNDDAVADATYLKWLPNHTDLTAIEAEIAAVQADIAAATATANNANATANAANATAATANNNANAALAAANGAANNAAIALDAANAAQHDADVAQTTADAAATTAAAAQTVANNAATQVAAINVIVGAATFFNNGVEYALVAGVVAEVNHGLGSTPKFVRWVLICKTAEFGYAVGDEIDVSSAFNTILAGRLSFTHGSSATKVFLVCADPVALHVSSKVDGSLSVLTPANWAAKVYAWK